MEDNAEIQDLNQLPRIRKRAKEVITKVVASRRKQRLQLRKVLPEILSDYNRRQAQQTKLNKRQQSRTTCTSNSTTSMTPFEKSAGDSTQEFFNRQSASTSPTDMNLPLVEDRVDTEALSESKSL